MATVLESLVIALRVDDGKMKAELAKLIDQARKAGSEGEKALKPFETGLSRVAAEARAGLRPLSEYREELKKQEAELRRVAAAQDKNSGEYRKTVEELASVKRELSSVTTELKTQETAFDKLGGRLTTFGGILSLGVTAPLAVLGGTGVKSAMQLEVFQRSLETLVGDAEDAKQVFEELYEFDTKTTFSWPSLTKATTLLSAFNVEAHDLIPTLGRLGDISAAVQMDVAELADTYGRMQVSGRVTMLELNQLMGRGIPIVQELAKNMGVSEAAIKDMASTGKLSFSDIEEAFTTLTSEGGRFHNMMQSQTDTTQGRVMALRKEFEQVTDQIGEALLPTLDGLVDRARKAVQWFVDLDEGTQALVINTGLFAAALGPLLLGLGQAVRVAGQLRTAFVALRAAGLLATGPAGWIVLGVAAVAGLAYAFSGKPDSLDKSLEKANQALAGGDAKSLTGALQSVEASLAPGTGIRARLAELRSELERTGEVGAEMAAAISDALLQAQLAPLQAKRAAIQARLETLVINESVLGGEFDAAAIEAQIEDLRKRGNELLDAGQDAWGISQEIQRLEALLLTGPATERQKRLADQMNAEALREREKLLAQMASIDEQIAALTNPVVPPPPAPKPDPDKDGVPGAAKKTPAEVLAELEDTRKQARGVALAHGETLEALAAEAQTMVGATSKAIDGLIAASVEPQDARIRKLVTDLGGLKEESERLNAALKPTQLASGATVEVSDEWLAGQRAIEAYAQKLEEIETRRSLGLIGDEDSLSAHLRANEDVINALIPLYGKLSDEQRAFVADTITGSSELERALEALARAEAARLAPLERAEALDDRLWDEWREEERARNEIAARRIMAENAERARLAGIMRDFNRHAPDGTLAGQWGAYLENDVERQAARMRGMDLTTTNEDRRVIAERRAAQEAAERAAQEQRAASVTTQEQMRLAESRRQSQPGYWEAYTQQAMLMGDRGNIRSLTSVGPFAELDAEQTAFVAKVRGDLAAAMDLAAAKAEALGDAYDLPKEQLRLTQAAIVELVEGGVLRGSEAMQPFIEDFKAYAKALQDIADQDARVKAFQDAMVFARDALGELPGPLETNIKILEDFKKELGDDEEAQRLREEIDRLVEALLKLKGIQDSPLRKFAGDVNALAASLPGLSGVFARSTGQIAEGLHKIAETDDKLEGTALVIRGVATAIEGITAAAQDGGLNGNQVMELIGGIASVAGEAIGALTGIPGLGQVVGAAFSLITLAVGDLSDGLAEVEEYVESAAQRMPLLAKETMAAFKDQYTRQVSSGGIAGSFGATKAELQHELFDAAVDLAGTFATTLATAMASNDFEKDLNLGFDRMIRDQLIEAFVLTPEVQAQIMAMVEFWQDAWKDGVLTDAERKRWDALRQGLIESGKATREQLIELGLIEDAEEQKRKNRVGGARITDLTGPARDHFSDLLAPLRHLGAQLATLQDIRNILDMRLPKGNWGSTTATAPGAGVIINGPLTVTTTATSARELFDEISRIAARKNRGK